MSVRAQNRNITRSKKHRSPHTLFLSHPNHCLPRICETHRPVRYTILPDTEFCIYHPRILQAYHQWPGPRKLIGRSMIGALAIEQPLSCSHSGLGHLKGRLVPAVKLCSWSVVAHGYCFRVSLLDAVRIEMRMMSMAFHGKADYGSRSEFSQR